MSNQNRSHPAKPEFVQLTDDQRAQPRAETGHDAIELGVQKLEERIAPFVMRKCVATPG